MDSRECSVQDGLIKTSAGGLCEGAYVLESRRFVADAASWLVLKLGMKRVVVVAAGGG
ncbi:hypothetical protein GLAREA_02326 [Glarea lozoyensis ATCC 20868]|uniref:Uncharacterized protein n=1 Tax=Glarea lozoyensis (strain ATCC 20868 / MF5171) TaxID=1116229 RepID=S3DIN5_GLAL2|nr:uncharacterized protein GLAREA_02326 [Glarea lozoyensis ATCC 20868]EPE26413.1 hypothetical protein GLAREA_02326 [Glarea lozoyensis ATCC 20868]